MQLNVTTDYAIRTVLYLGQCKKIASATEISNDRMKWEFQEDILRKCFQN